MENSETTLENETSDQEPIFDLKKVEELKSQLDSQQNLLLGSLGGVIAAVCGAAVWAGITIATQFQIGWMAVALGFIVGFAVRTLGKGITPVFGVVGAVCSLFGCILGNFLTTCGLISIQESVPIFQVIIALVTQPAILAEIFVETFNPMDILFYSIAVYEGYKFSFRQISEIELDSISKN